MSVWTNNIRLEEIATGDSSGSWGETTNANLTAIANSFAYGVKTLAADADETFTMADVPTQDSLRSMFLKIESAVDLTAQRTITLAPASISKVWIVENATTGGQNLNIAQGSGSTLVVKNGQRKIIYTDGAGSTASVKNALEDLSVDDLIVRQSLNLDVDGSSVNFGADAEIQLTHVADTGLLLTETGGGVPTLQFRDAALSVSSTVDGQLDIAADVETQIVSPTVDIDASTEVTIDTPTLTLTGDMAVTGTVDGRDIAADGAVLDTAVQPGDSPSFGSITVTGTVDGRDIDADGTKLDGIESGADVTNSTNVEAAGAALKSGTDFTGNVYFRGQTSGRDIVFDRSDNSLEFDDNAKAKFGDGGDLEIYHDGNNSFVSDVGTGNLKLQGENLRLEDTSGNRYFQGVASGASTLYHNGSVALNTTSVGIEVQSDNATIQLTDTDGSDYSRIRHNTGSLIIEADQGDEVLESAIRFDVDGDEKMRITDDNGILIGKTVSSQTQQGIMLFQSGTVYANAYNNAPLVLNRDLFSAINNQIATFSANDTVVGSIRYRDGFVIDGESDHTGIKFGGSAVIPRDSQDDANGTVDLGNASYRWDTLFATNGTINTSDQNEKQQIASLTAAEITAAKSISQLFKTFKWNSAVASKGDAARTHTGVIAQDVEAALTNAGLNAGDYAFFTSDTWWESDGATYYTLADAPAGATEHNIKGIRYSELLAFVSAATEQRLADIETRLTALEA